MSPEAVVLARAAHVVNNAPTAVIVCDQQPAPGVWCGDAARYSVTCMDCGGQRFYCPMHFWPMTVLEGICGDISYMAVIG